MAGDGGGMNDRRTRQRRLAKASGSSGGTRQRQHTRMAATIHISFWINGPPGAPMKEASTFWCEDDALQFLWQRKFAGKQHGTAWVEPATPPAPETQTAAWGQHLVCQQVE